jgi:hypothetical protein
MRLKQITNLFLVVLSIFLFSCNDRKEANISPENLLTVNIKGKWELSDFPITLPEKQGVKKHSNLRKRISSLSLSPNLRLSTNGNKPFIEFLDDENFVISKGSWDNFYGKYSVLNSTSVLLEGIGEISNIELNANNLAFKINFQGTDISVNATKTGKISSNSKNSLLCIRWDLDTKQFEIDNDEIFWDGYEYDELKPDRLEVTFSEYGTYMGVIYSGKTILESEVSNWKWHETKTDAFNYWHGNDFYDGDYVLIEKLTRDILIVKETFDEEDYYDEIITVLHPAK